MRMFTYQVAYVYLPGSVCLKPRQSQEKRPKRDQKATLCISITRDTMGTMNYYIKRQALNFKGFSLFQEE